MSNQLSVGQMVEPVPSIHPVSTSASNAGSAVVDTQGYHSFSAVVDIASVGAGSLDVVLQHSDDEQNWSNLYDFGAQAAAFSGRFSAPCAPGGPSELNSGGVKTSNGSVLVKRYLRYVTTQAGGGTSVYGAFIILGGPAVTPTP